MNHAEFHAAVGQRAREATRAYSSRIEAFTSSVAGLAGIPTVQLQYTCYLADYGSYSGPTGEAALAALDAAIARGLPPDTREADASELDPLPGELL